jgi:hypothetical protein
MKKLTDSKISLIEKIIINWATPVEILFVRNVYLQDKAGMIEMHPPFKKFIEEEGVIKGLWNSKIKDYARLVKYSDEDKKIPKKVLKLYDGTPCGAVMKLTYKVFREK